MGKALGIGFVVFGIWVGAEVMMEGVYGAFGGLFVKAGLVQEPASLDTPSRSAERAAVRLQDAYREQMERVERQELE